MCSCRWDEFEKKIAVGNDGCMSFDEDSFIKSVLAEPAGGEEDNERSFERKQTRHFSTCALKRVGVWY